MDKTLVVDYDLCVGCELCSQICAWSKFKAINPRRAGIHVIRDEPSLLDAPVFCSQCGICIDVCPKDALTRVEEGWIEVDDEKCDACGLCAPYCPISAIHIDTITKTAVKCDLCKGKPVCTDWCPQGAIKFIEAKEAAFLKQRTAARSVSMHGAHTWWGRHKLWYKKE